MKIQLASALLIGTLATNPASAHAARPPLLEGHKCITTHEYRAFPILDLMTRAETERWLGVVDEGEVAIRNDDPRDSIVILYEWCNHPYPHDNMQVSYERRRRDGKYVAWAITRFEG